MFQDKPSQRLAYLVKEHNRNPIVLRHTYLSQLLDNARLPVLPKTTSLT